MALILVVDDDKDMEGLIREVLHADGHSVICAKHGEEALKKLGLRPHAARATRPDLIFMNYLMPVMNGIAAADAIAGHAGTSGIPVIITSGSPIEHFHALRLPPNVAAVLTTPFDIAALRRMAARGLAISGKSPGGWTQAETALDRAITQDPTARDLRRFRASRRALAQEWQGVVEDLAQVLSTDGRAVFGLLLAKAYELSGDSDAAASECDRELSILGKSAEHLAFRAALKQQRGDLPGAVQDLLAAARLGRKAALYWALLAEIEVDLGKLKDALKHLDKVVALDPADWRHRTHRGFVSIKLGRWAEAERDFTSVLESLPEKGACREACQEAFKFRGYARFKRNEDGALEDLDHAVRLDPKDPVALCLRGNARWSKDDPKAIEDFDAAVAADPRDAAAFSARGDYRRCELRDRKGAVADYAQAVRLDPLLFRPSKGRPPWAPRPGARPAGLKPGRACCPRCSNLKVYRDKITLPDRSSLYTYFCHKCKLMEDALGHDPVYESLRKRWEGGG